MISRKQPIDYADPACFGLLRDFLFVAWHRNRRGEWQACGSADSIRDLREELWQRYGRDTFLILPYGQHPDEIADAKEREGEKT